ncbi:MAG: 16S rRNA (cytosine(1402)-N(4))-methyltransferase RsmH [Candidatus Shapirobacteria bacterium]|jgi:16S rRNA (cytosine1402-N4)-methyltransferase
MDYHQSVLANEIVQLLSPDSNKIFIDATLGHGGHTLKLLERGAIVYGLDADPLSLEIAKKRIGKNSNFHPINANFRDIGQIFKIQINQPLDGILFDLGLNLYQLKQQNRGFSFDDTDTLDMRLNPDQSSPTATDLINKLTQTELENLFSKYVQQPFSREICQTIVNRRQHRKITTAKELSEIVKEFYLQKKIFSSKHPATLIFLGLRIAVNQEFESLSLALNDCLSIGLPKTTIAVISFHSGEDRIVKNFIRQNNLPTGQIKKPSTSEIHQNPLSRSAILRWFSPK